MLAPITEVLDTIDRAREHGELEGGFKAVADQLERIVAGLGLVKFGAVGDAFDPTIHEALSHIGEDPEVEVTTCKVDRQGRLPDRRPRRPGRPGARGRPGDQGGPPVRPTMGPTVGPTSAGRACRDPAVTTYPDDATTAAEDSRRRSDDESSKTSSRGEVRAW